MTVHNKAGTFRMQQEITYMLHRHHSLSSHYKSSEKILKYYTTDPYWWLCTLTDQGTDWTENIEPNVYPATSATWLWLFPYPYFSDPYPKKLIEFQNSDFSQYFYEIGIKIMLIVLLNFIKTRLYTMNASFS